MPQNSNQQAKNRAASTTGQAMITVADRVLDITAETCPMTFVRTRLALDGMASGQILLVLLRGSEPRERVPQTARALGHAVLGQEDQPGGVTRLLLRRA